MYYGLPPDRVTRHFLGSTKFPPNHSAQKHDYNAQNTRLALVLDHVRSPGPMSAIASNTQPARLMTNSRTSSRISLILPHSLLIDCSATTNRHRFSTDTFDLAHADTPNMRSNNSELKIDPNPFWPRHLQSNLMQEWEKPNFGQTPLEADLFLPFVRFSSTPELATLLASV